MVGTRLSHMAWLGNIVRGFFAQPLLRFPLLCMIEESDSTKVRKPPQKLSICSRINEMREK